MFKCTNCGDQVAVNQPMNKVIVERRSRNYENLPKPPKYKDKNRQGPREQGRNRSYRQNPTYTSGWEIVKEIGVCPKCFLSFTGKQPKIKEPTPPKRANPRFIDEESTRKYGGNRNKPYEPRQQKERKVPVVEVVNPVKLERS